MSVVDQLTAALGALVDTALDSLESARADQSGHAAPGRPIAVVHAETVEQVQTVMRIATETRTPVVVRGAGTGLAGAANGGDGEIVLSTLRMTAIREVRPDDLLAVTRGRYGAIARPR